MRTLVIVNPKGGGVSDLAQVASTIRHHPAVHHPDIRFTGARDDASLLAREGRDLGFRRILVVGGDGTLNETVNGLLPDAVDVELGLLPLGTGNDFARTLGLPLDLEEALESMERWRPRTVDAVRVEMEGGDGTRHFVNASAGGFSGEVDQENTSERKASWGPLSYLRSALDVLPDPTCYETVVEVDGETWDPMELINVVVANGRSVAGGIPIAPEAAVDDGLLDVVLVRSAALGQLAGFGSRCMVGRHLDHELAEFVRAREVRIRATPAMPFNLDGELVGETPLTYTVVPGALRILAPPPEDD